MEKRAVLWGVTFAAVLALGCSTQLAKGLRNGVYPLGYMLDSKQCAEKAPVTVRLDTVCYCKEFNSFGDSLTAKTKFWYFIPLVVFNFGGATYNCELGKASLDKNIIDFVKSAYVKEATRSGCFRLVDSGDADYTLNVSIQNHETKGPYSSFFYVYFALYIYGFGDMHSAGPGQSKVSMAISLKGKDGAVFNRQFEKTTMTEMIRNKKNDLNEMNRNYVNGLVESLSMAFKDCIEQSVCAVNDQVVKK